MRFVSIPTVVEAIQWTGDNFAEILADIPEKVRLSPLGLELLAGVDGAQEWVPVPTGHWLLHLPDDLADVWPIDPDKFYDKYRSESS